MIKSDGQCSFDHEDRNVETKKHTTLKGFAEKWRQCHQKPLFTFLTHFSGRKRMDPETGEKSLSTEACVAKRILSDYPELADEVSLVFDNMLVYFDDVFPSLRLELEML